MRRNKKNWVTITVNIEDELLLALALEAHRRDMKLNDYIVELLEKYIKERECQEMI